MLRPYLTADAFKRPQEQKNSLQKDYQALYGAESVEKEYLKTADSLDADKRQKFQNQFARIMDALEQWGKANGINALLLAKITPCKNNFFDASYSGSQTPHYFSTIKQNLENIWFALITETSIPLKKNQVIFSEFCSSLHVCAPGLYTYIEDTNNRLNCDISLERWLAEFRANITRQYADLHTSEFKIDSGNSIHVYNVFLNYALIEGWAPLSDIDKTIDPFAAVNTDVDESILVKFHQFFLDNYIPSNIVNCVSTNFYVAMNNLKMKLEVKEAHAPDDVLEKKGWNTYSVDYVKQATQLAAAIGVKEEHASFFDLKNDLIRFNPTLFKAAFLKSCKENDKLFPASIWREISLIDGHKIYYDGEHLAWMENPDNEITDWENSQLNVNACVSIGRIIRTAKINDLPMIIANTVKDIKKTINSCADLIIILNNIPKKRTIEKFLNFNSKLNFILYKYLDTELFNKIIRNRHDILYLTEQLKTHESSKVLLQRILTFSHKDFLIEAIKENDAIALERLFNEAQLPILTDAYGKLLLVNAAMMNNVELIKALVQKGVNLDVTIDEAGNTLAHLAASKSNIAIIELLARHDINLNQANSQGETLVHIAARNTDTEISIIHALGEYKAIDFNLKNKGNITPLQIALDKGNLWISLALLHNGAVLDESTIKHYQQDMDQFVKMAASHGYVDVIKMIFGHFEKLELYDTLKANQPYVAAIAITHNKPEVIKFLAAEKVDFDQISQPDSPLLHYAVETNRTDIIKILVAANAHLERRNSFGYTPMEFAYLHGKKAIMALLTELGAQKIKVQSDDTPIQQALEQKNWELASLKVQLGPLTPEEKNTPSVLLAAKRGDTTALKLLAEFKADLTITDEERNTAAHIAASHYQPNIFQALAELGVLKLPDYILCKNKKNETAALIALAKNNFNIIYKIANLSPCFIVKEFEFAIQHQQWEMLVFMLKTKKSSYIDNTQNLFLDKTLIEQLHKNREQLTTAFISLAKKMDAKEQYAFVTENLFPNKTALGVIINTHHVSYFSKTKKGYTACHLRIFAELKLASTDLYEKLRKINSAPTEARYNRQIKARLKLFVEKDEKAVEEKKTEQPSNANSFQTWLENICSEAINNSSKLRR